MLHCPPLRVSVRVHDLGRVIGSPLFVVRSPISQAIPCVSDLSRVGYSWHLPASVSSGDHMRSCGLGPLRRASFSCPIVPLAVVERVPGLHEEGGSTVLRPGAPSFSTLRPQLPNLSSLLGLDPTPTSASLPATVPPRSSAAYVSRSTTLANRIPRTHAFRRLLPS